MTPILTLLLSSMYIRPLTSLLGWVGWLLFLGGVIAATVRWRRFQAHSDQRWLLFTIFVLLVPLTNLFLGVRLPSGASLPESGIPQAPQPPALMVFSALPWMLAGGLLGPVDALVIALLSGLVRSLWDTHNFFSILEPALLAVLFSSAVRQRYRTPFYRIMRQPLVIGLGLIPVYTFVFVFSAFFSVAGVVAARLDFALTNSGPATLAAAGELLVSGVFVQIAAAALPQVWGRPKTLEPSPAERSLETRFLLGGGTFVSLLLIALLVGDWIVAGNAARRMIRDRLASTAQVAADSVPFFLETGQNLTSQLAADPRLLNESGSELSTLLGEQMRAEPYFDQLFVLGSQDELVAAYPGSDSANFGLFPQEHIGLGLAGQGVAVQVYTIPPSQSGGSARVSFLTAIVDSSGKVQRILLGRSALAHNPLTQPLINSLNGTRSLGGVGLLLDDQGLILYSPNADQIMTPYTDERGSSAIFYESPAPRGTRNLVYYQPALGRSWAVVLTVPAVEVQQLALDIAAPLSILVLVLAVAALVFLRLGLRVVTASLHELATELARIAQGRLDHPLAGGGEDEVGQLSRAFEQMRLSLRARLEELNQLLLVSQGVASTLDMEGAVQPILKALLATGASAVRLVLAFPDDQTQGETPPRFSTGPAGEAVAYLDDQVLALTRKQGRQAIPHLSRVRLLDLPKGEVCPASLLAVPLFHEGRFDGVLWAAFDQPHPFPEEYVSFASTLAGYAALAVTNARLFHASEVGRQRLAAILASTPDPVLVTDQESHLLLANPAARSALGMLSAAAEGQPTEKAISQKELRELLQELEGGKKSAEIVMPDGKVYFATASEVLADGRPVGRICVLQDVTHFKELDTLKSDFVSSVSHDLRSPLTLMRGYTTMLELTGKLNEQQREYVSKITTGVDGMGRLVDTLLDLGRLEAGVELQVEDVPLAGLVKDVLDMLAPQAGQKRIELGVDFDSSPLKSIEADRALLHQALYNLVENAIKYTPEGRWVRLRVKVFPEAIMFEVQDNGIGIASADQPRLFEKFYRGSQREARAQRGSGLGLAIVQSIAKRHGGKVWLDSQLGKGSTFFLLIPIYQPEAVKKQTKAV